MVGSVNQTSLREHAQDHADEKEKGMKRSKDNQTSGNGWPTVNQTFHSFKRFFTISDPIAARQSGREAAFFVPGRILRIQAGTCAASFLEPSIGAGGLIISPSLGRP
jgi:hypothetical protein